MKIKRFMHMLILIAIVFVQSNLTANAQDVAPNSISEGTILEEWSLTPANQLFEATYLVTLKKHQQKVYAYELNIVFRDQFNDSYDLYVTSFTKETGWDINIQNLHSYFKNINVKAFKNNIEQKKVDPLLEFQILLVDSWRLAGILNCIKKGQCPSIPAARLRQKSFAASPIIRSYCGFTGREFRIIYGDTTEIICKSPEFYLPLCVVQHCGEYSYERRLVQYKELQPLNTFYSGTPDVFDGIPWGANTSEIDDLEIYDRKGAYKYYTKKDKSAVYLGIPLDNVRCYSNEDGFCGTEGEIASMHDFELLGRRLYRDFGKPTHKYQDGRRRWPPLYIHFVWELNDQPVITLSAPRTIGNDHYLGKISLGEMPPRQFFPYKDFIRAKDAPLPKLENNLIRTEKMKYLSTIETDSRSGMFYLTRHIKPSTIDDRKCWNIIYEFKWANGSSITEGLIDESNLSPVKQNSFYGSDSTTTLYNSDSISYTDWDGIHTNISLDNSVIADGPGFECVVASLSLSKEPIYLRMFDNEFKRVRPLKLQKIGRESVKVPAGTFETLVVELTYLDGNNCGSGTLYVLPEKPHYLIKQATQMWPSWECGNLTVELVEL